MSRIELVAFMQPTPWKRPAGSRVRYDAQIEDKIALAAAFYASCSAIRGRVTPLFPKEGLHVNYSFAFADEEKMRKMDLDNLVKFTQDTMQSQSLEGKIWTDDRQVVSLAALKYHSNGNYIKVTVTPFGHKDTQQ